MMKKKEYIVGLQWEGTEEEIELDEPAADSLR